MLCEEWGLLIALTAVLAIVFFVFYAVMLISYSESAYAIAASVRLLSFDSVSPECAWFSGYFRLRE